MKRVNKSYTQLNKNQRKKVKEEYEKIEKMDLAQIREYSQKLYIAKDDLDFKIFYWLELGVESTRDYLESLISPMAETSELRVGEV